MRGPALGSVAFEGGGGGGAPGEVGELEAGGDHALSRLAGLGDKAAVVDDLGDCLGLLAAVVEGLAADRVDRGCVAGEAGQQGLDDAERAGGDAAATDGVELGAVAEVDLEDAEGTGGDAGAFDDVEQPAYAPSGVADPRRASSSARTSSIRSSSSGYT